MSPPLRRLIAVCALAGLFPAVAAAAPGLTDAFDGPDATWALPPNPGATRILEQRRVRIDRQGREAGAEYLRFACPTGYSGLFLYAIGQSPVIEDTQITLGYRGTTPGAQLAARVVFPRTAAPESPGDEAAPAALTTVVRGEGRYEAIGEWAELSLSQLPLLVQRQARLLRSGGAQDIDERGAYVDSVVLIVPSSPQGAQFWTTDLRIEGAVVTELNGRSANGAGDASAQERDEPFEVRASARGVTADGKPVFPIVWRSRGESLGLVRKLKFNAVAMPAFPSASVLATARSEGVRLIVPPPINPALPAADLVPILGWASPSWSDRPALDAARPLIDSLRNDAALATRPILSTPHDAVEAWSRLSDMVVLDAGPATPLAPQPFRRGRAALIPGIPAAARVRLTRHAQTLDQLRAFAPVGRTHVWREPDAVANDVWRAVAGGARGVWLESDAPLGGASPADRKTAAAVELLNLKLSLIEPWLAGGESDGPVTGPDRKPRAAVVRRGRTKLLLGLDGTPTSGRTKGGLIVPAVSETSLAYSVTPAGLAPVSRRRTLGGVQLGVDSLRPGEMLMLTDDRRAVRDFAQRIKKLAPRAVALEQQLATADLEELETVLAAAPATVSASLRAVPAGVRGMISRSKASQSNGDLPAAYRAASDARAQLAQARARSRAAISPRGGLESSPLAHAPSTWADEARLQELVRSLPRATNLLAGGDFESLDEIRKSGWRNTSVDNGARDSLGAPGSDAESPASESHVELSGENPRHGSMCLKLHHEGNATPSGWITSPQVALRAGQLVEITGWARFEGDGALAVVDSLGGEELALAIGEGHGWRPFRMLRRPMQDAELKLSFVLSGAGTASIDAVMIRPVLLSRPTLQPAAAPRPAMQPSGATQRK